MEDNWKFLHIGVAVKDLKKATKYLESIGIMASAPPPMGKGAPPAVNDDLELENIEEHLVDYEVHGKPADPQTLSKCKFFTKGSLLIEVVQPVKGKTIATDFLESQGDGLYHFCFAVDDLEKETAKMAKGGAPVVSRGTTDLGGQFAYVDTRKVLNFMLEIVCDTPKKSRK